MNDKPNNRSIVTHGYAIERWDKAIQMASLDSVIALLRPAA